jgi:beta-glucosidase
VGLGKGRSETYEFSGRICLGVATAAHQVEGGCTNNWSAWENSTNENNNPRIQNDEKSGIACDHWNRYQDDIQLIKTLVLPPTDFRLNGAKWNQKKVSLMPGL